MEIEHIMVVLLAAVYILVFIKATKGGESTNSKEIWPAGTYGLPKAASGCPDGQAFEWSEGWLRQEMQNSGRSYFSPNFHMNASMNGYFITRAFCMKDKTSQIRNDVLWPKGSYCIYQKRKCPKGMQGGHIRWDDEDTKNDNGASGSLPSGLYYQNTKIYYCCQTRGAWYESIVLPTEKPFYLMPRTYLVCQRVKWTFSSLEYITFNTENERNDDKFAGVHAASNKRKGSPTIYYCYYHSCRNKITANEGSFSSNKSYNRLYPSHQYCSWLITVDARLVVSLDFEYLRVPNCKGNYIDLYDGTNVTSPFLARLCGSNATVNHNILSSGNTIYMVVKSGRILKIEERLGFHARYKAQLNPKGCQYNLSADVNGLKSINNTYRNFPDFKRCSWMITTNTSFVIDLEFTYFNLPNCDNSFINVYDGHSEKTTPATKLCGGNSTIKTKKQTSSGNKILIVFESVYNITYNKEILGFGVQYKAVARPTKLPTKLESPTTNATADNKERRDGSTVIPVISVASGITIILIVTFTLVVICWKRRKYKNDDPLHVMSGEYEMSADPEISHSSSAQEPEINQHKEQPNEVTQNPVYEPAVETITMEVDASSDNILYEPVEPVKASKYIASPNPLYNWPEKYRLPSAKSKEELFPPREERIYAVLENSDGDDISSKEESDGYYSNVD